MYILKCVLSFMFLLLYVEFNSAIDCDVDCHAYLQFQTDHMLKHLVEYENKIEQLQLKIKNQETKEQKLQAKIREMATTIATLEAKLAKDESIADPTEPTSCLPFGNSSDIHTIRLPGTEAFQVPCDSRFAGNGWIVIHRRIDGSVSFNRTWDEYRQGFGDLRGELWLGLEKLHLITKFQPHELYVQLEDFNNEIRYARYSNFSVGSESQLYELLSLGDFTGTDGPALSEIPNRNTAHLNMKFSTPDRDNDISNGNCARDYSAGWWYHNCYSCNLNGVYPKTNEKQYFTILWGTWHLMQLKFVQMMIRPV